MPIGVQDRVQFCRTRRRQELPIKIPCAELRAIGIDWLAATPDTDVDGRPELWVGAAGLSDTASTQGRIFLFESLNL